MNQDKNKFYNSIKIPLIFVSVIWLIKTAETISGISFVQMGLLPREPRGLLGIITFPLIHGDWDHLTSNTLSVLFLSTGLFYFYPTSAKKVVLMNYFIPGVLLWFFARHSFHIGASGLIYGLASFIFFSGIIRRDKRAVVLALIVTFFYGGLVWGILPIKDGVSWEGHLFGAATGFIAAIIFRKKDPFRKYDWEDDSDDDDYNVRDLEISYKKGYPFE